MNLPAGAVAGLSLLSVFLSAPAAAVIIPVSQDVSVLGGSKSNQNYENNTYYGGLFSGVYGAFSSSNPSDAPARFYLMFALPKLDAGTTISSATLKPRRFSFWKEAKLIKAQKSFSP